MPIEEFRAVDWRPFRTAFPTLFSARRIISLDAGHGWRYLLWNLCLSLEAYAKDQVADGLRPVQVVQIKQKFGGLRFYVDGGDQATRAMVAAAEEIAEVTCEACGAPAKPKRINGWITGSATSRSLYSAIDADYKIFKRRAKTGSWEVSDLSAPVFLEAVKELPEDAPVELSIDDTHIRKTGKKIPQARYCHDPLAPKFLERAFCWGIRMLHCAVKLPPPPVNAEGYTRSVMITTTFKPVPAAEKPKKGALLTEAEKVAFEARKREATITNAAVEAIRWHRKVLDDNGQKHRKLLLIVDGSYANRQVVDHLPTHNTELVGRFREGADLREFLPKEKRKGRQVYGRQLPTPKEYLTKILAPIQTGRFRYGGRERLVRFMEVNGIQWKGTKGRQMRMLIVRPTPFNRGKSRSRSATPGKRRAPKRGYNRPAYLITTDLTTPAPVLIQAYLDRWQIEVLHRELKSDIGVGQAQVRNFLANERIHTVQALTYGALSLAAYRAFGGQWTKAFPALPSWRKRPPMRLTPSQLLARFRHELVQGRFFGSPKSRKGPRFEGCVLPDREIYMS